MRSLEVTPCSKCGSTERYKNRNCVPCGNAYGKQYRKDNAEAIKRAKSTPAYKAGSRKRERKLKGWLPGEHERAEALLPLVDRCECCGSSNPRHKKGWKADHNHITRRFRGFLCHQCNVVIGFAEKYGTDYGPLVRAYLCVHKK